MITYTAALLGVSFTLLFMNGETSPKIYKIGCWVSFDQVTKFCVFAPKWYVCDIASVGILNSGYTNTFFCKMNCFSLKNVLLYVECKSHSSTRNISSLGYLCMHTGVLAAPSYTTTQLCNNVWPQKYALECSVEIVSKSGIVLYWPDHLVCSPR